MTRLRATVLSFFSGLGFYYCVSRIVTVIWLLSLNDPPPREWAMTLIWRWGAGAFGLLLVTVWAIYKIWLLWDE